MHRGVESTSFVARQREGTLSSQFNGRPGRIHFSISEIEKLLD